jgi:transposase
MPHAYSDDLRCKLLEAYAGGAGSLRELATRFGVSWGFSKKIRVQQVQTGQMERPAQLRHGPVSQVTAEVQEKLRSWLRKQPDLTLAELREQLASNGVRISRSRVHQVVEQLGLRRKKNLSTPKNKTPKKAADAAKRGGRR